jgi:hypothetical protein
MTGQLTSQQSADLLSWRLLGGCFSELATPDESSTRPNFPRPLSCSRDSPVRILPARYASSTSEIRLRDDRREGTWPNVGDGAAVVFGEGWIEGKAARIPVKHHGTQQAICRRGPPDD